MWLIENLNFESKDVLVIVYNRSPDIGMSPQNFLLLVDDFFANSTRPAPSVVYAPLDAPTVGAAETVLREIELINPTRVGCPAVLLEATHSIRMTH